MGKSRKTKTRTKKREPKTTNKTEQKEAKEKTLPRLDAVERVPSNAPTMAIAPSDYEHIFHEGPAGSAAVTADGPLPTATANNNGAGIRTFPVSPPSPQPPAPPPPQPPQPPPPQPAQPPAQPAQPPTASLPMREMSPSARQPTRTRNEDTYSSPRQPNYYANQTELQVTPDGYTMLGQQPAESTGGRRIPLPAHIVRAGNQFSRAALVRVARYLSSRSEYR